MKKNIKQKKVVFFCSHTQDGNMSKKYGNEEEVKKNIQNFFEKVGISQKDCCNYTILNSDVICTYEQLQNGLEETDAVIITKPNQYVYLNFGDCIPLVVFDNQKNILGFAHMGWNSICKDLHMKLIRYMMQNYESELKDLTVYFGPSISSDSYAFANPAQKDMPEWKDFLYKENDLYHIDLVGYIIQGLEKLGIDQREIIKNNVDTATNKDYYSHYRSTHFHEVEGRFIFGVGIEL